MGSREVDMNNERCSFEEDELPENNAPTGAITEYIDKSIDFAEFNSRISYTDWLSEVKSLEEELVTSLKKAKEEERHRIVGILEEMKNNAEDMDEYSAEQKEWILQEAIERIKFIS